MPKAAEVTAFVDVNVVPMDTDRVLANQTVLVEGGRITALGPSDQVRVPAGAVRIAGRGRYLMPGLADMHMHFVVTDSINKEAYKYTGSEFEPGHWYGSGVAFGASQTSDGAAYRLFSALAHGVTLVRYFFPPTDARYGSSGAENKSWWRRIKTGEIVGPRLYTTPVWVSERRGKFDLTRIRLDSVAGYKAAGHNFIMLDASVGQARDTLPVVDSFVKAARQAGLPIADHGHARSFDAMLAVGTYGGSFEHLGPFWYALGFVPLKTDTQWDTSTVKIQTLARAAQRAGVWITPTLNCEERKFSWPTLGDPSGSPPIELTRRIVKALQEAGVGLLLGADADHAPHLAGTTVQTELAALVRAGLTPYQALLTGTRNVAQYFGQLDSSGTVAVGKWADLVLLDGNPLADVRHTREPAGVMIRGQWLDRAALEPRLLADPKTWFTLEVVYGFEPHLTAEQVEKIGGHVKQFRELLDSLAAVTSKPSESARVRQRLAAALGAMRTILTPEQRVAFDPKARMWLREQARQGYQVAVAGVTLTP